MPMTRSRLAMLYSDRTLSQHSGPDAGRIVFGAALLDQRIRDLDAMLEVAHHRWEAACSAEDIVLAARPNDEADDDERFRHMRALVLAMKRREDVWKEYERIVKLRARIATAC
jgi:hypothetical protein